MTVPTMQNLVNVSALSGIGIALFVVPAFSASLPTIYSFPLVGFWFYLWLNDARFTAKNWRFVVEGHEANVFVLALAGLAACRPTLVLSCHLVFSVGAAIGLQMLVTQTFDFFLASLILAIFGLLHASAFYRSRAFVMKMRKRQMMGEKEPQQQQQQRPREQNAAEKERIGKVNTKEMLLKTKYWRYFVRLCENTGFDISTLRHIISTLDVGGEKRIGDYSFRLVAVDEESFGTVYRIEVYLYAHDTSSSVTSSSVTSSSVTSSSVTSSSVTSSSVTSSSTITTNNSNNIMRNDAVSDSKSRTAKPLLVLKSPVLLDLPPRIYR